MKKLSELSSGSTGKIAAINGDTHFQSRVITPQSKPLPAKHSGTYTGPAVTSTSSSTFCAETRMSSPGSTTYANAAIRFAATYFTRP